MKIGTERGLERRTENKGKVCKKERAKKSKRGKIKSK